MKTHPSENDNHGSTRKQDFQTLESSPSKLTGEFEKGLNQEYEINNEIHNSSESDNLIICSPELAARFQSPSSDKHKLNPGHYLQKVFLNSVAQKIKSQSLPNCFEKKKFQKKAATDIIDELHETSVPLVESTGIDPGLSSSCTEENESTTNQWFKTWPERGTDKVVLRNPDDPIDAKDSITLAKVSNNITRPTSLILKRNESNHFSSEQELELQPNSISADRSDQRLCKLPTKESPLLYASSSKANTSHVSSVNLSDQQKNTISNRVRENSKTVPLEDLLTNISLAYSPVTKQLHLIKTDSHTNPILSNNKPAKELTCTFSESLNLEENTYDKVNSEKERTSFNSSSGTECDQPSNTFHRVNTEVSSFSSTVSSLSDNSPSTTNEDSALGSLLDHGDTCSLVSVGACSAFSEDSIGSKPKKKSLTGFFSKNVFNWKSGSRSEENTEGNGGGPAWRLFGKNSSPQLSQTSLTVDCNEKDAWSLAPDSPCSVRSSSSGSARTFSHENRVASSSALIQLDRPANLPAKSEEEEARHRQEYQQMVEAARKKELKDAKQRKKQLQLQHKVEDQLAHATRVWTREILQKWEQMHSSKKARELWWQGVPPCVRGKVWKLAIGNSLNLTHSLFDICVQRAQDRLKTGEVSCSDEDDSDNKEASMQVIQLDISRTFPHLCIFQKGGPYYDMLHCLLAAYVCYRPDVGYVQGMSFIAAVLILNMEAADAFVCFANLLDQPCHKAFFQLNQPLMQAYYFTYNELFKENLPQLYDHFTGTTLTPDLYLLDWLYTVFTKAMNLDLASRVWDLFLRDGEEFLFRTALGVLHLFQDNLLQMDFVHGSQFLTRLPDDLSGDLLFKSIACIKMTVGKQTFESILRAHSIHCH